MFFLIVAGISVGASLLQWWNEGRIEEVEREIAELEARRDEILAADADVREAIIAPYREALAKAVRKELEARAQIRSELEQAEKAVRGMTLNAFAGLDEAGLRQVHNELELAHARLAAEETYLSSLYDAILLRGDLPDPALLMPDDYPSEGRLLPLEKGVSVLHGYRLAWEDRPASPGALVAVYDVQHEQRHARASAVRGKLLEAALSAGAEPLSVTVKQQGASGVILEFEGVQLVLPRGRGSSTDNLTPGQRMDVYLEPASIADVLKAPRRTEERTLLRVTSHRRVEGASLDLWSPLGVRYRADQYEALMRVFDEIESNSWEDTPWLVTLAGSGTALDFTIETFRLRLLIDPRAKCFELVEILEGTRSPTAIRVNAELKVFGPDEEDDGELNPTVFDRFIESVDSELCARRRRYIERHASLELRKLSMIYQDQAEAERRAGSVGLFVIAAKTGRAQTTVQALLLDPTVPDWLAEAVVKKGPAQKLRLVGGRNEFKVDLVKWSDPTTSMFEFVLPAGTAYEPEAVRGISHIVLTTQGMQQELLSRATEDAIDGKFVSAAVRSQFLSFMGERVDAVAAETSDEVRDHALNSPDFFAIWGPPGTGKTTLLVKLLTQYIADWQGPQPPQILISAPTHVAVNELLGRLLEKSPDLKELMVRYMADEADLPIALADISNTAVLRELRNASNHETALGKSWLRLWERSDGRAAISRWALAGRSIHAATCVGMMRRDFGLNNRQFDLAIVDEAGKAFGAELLLPVLRAKKVILAGDHRQLPPTVTADVLDRRMGYRLSMDEVGELLTQNFFGRIFDHLSTDSKGLLALQYRMHPEIGQVVSQLFYDGKLRSAPMPHARWPSQIPRVLAIDFARVRQYQGRPGPTGLSQENLAEADAACDLLHAARERFGTLPITLVVCPYDAQRQRMAQNVAREFGDCNVKVSTVDAVQGGEATWVLLLMTRTRGRSDFLLDRHRLNVALSRSKEAVFVLANFEYLARGVGETKNVMRQFLATPGVHRLVVPSDSWRLVGERVFG